MAPSGRSTNCLKIVEIVVLHLHNFGPKSAKKIFQKNPGKVSNFFFFFFDFSEKFFLIEIIIRECRLRTQNFMTIGHTILAVGKRTDKLSLGYFI